MKNKLWKHLKCEESGLTHFQMKKIRIKIYGIERKKNEKIIKNVKNNEM